MKKTLSLILVLMLTACLFASVMVLADEEPVTVAAPIEGEPVPDGEPIVGAPVPDGEPIVGAPVPDGEPIVGAPVPDGEEGLDIAVLAPPEEEEEELVVLEPNGVKEGDDITPKNIDGGAPMPEKTLAVTDIFVAVFCLILLIITGIYFYTMYKREQAKEAAEAKEAEEPETKED